MNNITIIWVLPALVILFSPGAKARSDAKTDSLHALLATNPADTTKVDVFISLHQQLSELDTAKSFEYLQKAIELSQVTGDKKRVAKAFLKLALYYDYRGDLLKAKEALDKLEQQLPFFHDINIEAAFYMERGIIFYYQGNYDKAVRDIYEALENYERLGDSATVASCNILIGEAYRKLENPDRALFYFNKALNIYKNTGDEKGMAMALGNMGIVYKSKNDYAKALEYYQQSLQINQKYGFREEARIDLSNIASLYTDMGEYEKALQYHTQSLELAQLSGSQYGIVNSKYNLAILKSKTGDYKSSLAGFNEVLEAAGRLGYKDMIMDTYLALSNLYEETGNYRLALGYRKDYETWRDSLINEKHMNQVKELELKYETAKKDQQIIMLDKEKEIQKKEAQRQSTLKNAFIAGDFFIFQINCSYSAVDNHPDLVV